MDFDSAAAELKKLPIVGPAMTVDEPVESKSVATSASESDRIRAAFGG